MYKCLTIVCPVRRKLTFPPNLPKTMADEDKNKNEKVKKFRAHSVASEITEELKKQKNYQKRVNIILQKVSKC